MQDIKYIGVCLSTIHEEDRFYFVKELNIYAVKNNYRLIVFNSCADLYDQNTDINKGTLSVFRLIPYDKLSALIIFPNIMYDDDIVDEVVEKCHKNKIPVISIDREIAGCTTFTFDNAKAFEKLCCHVIEHHGARKIYMIAGFKNNVYSEERIAAFRNALEKNGIPFEQNNIGYGCFWETPTIDLLNEWFVEQKREVPDAIICANDFMAITTNNYLQEMGYKIPDDCIITGFDGIKQAEYLPPSLTTAKHNFNEMGRLIIETINKVIIGEKTEKKFVVDLQIIYSQSCGCMGINYEKTSNSIRSLIDSLHFSDERKKILLHAQSSIPRITNINYLPRTLVNRFNFNTCVVALNENIFTMSDSEIENYKNRYYFNDNVKILYHKYNSTEYEQCIIPSSRLFPRYDLFIENIEPIIVCCTNFKDFIMGYCIFQPPVDIDIYEKVNGFISTMGSALGIFYNRAKIKNINDKLIKVNNELEKLSERDYMTGLFNRRGFFNHLEKRLNDINNIGSELMFISIDSDGLKYINDTFGHSEGDNAIITVGKVLVSCSLNNDICARFGGDEFCVAIIIDDTDSKTFFNDFKKRFYSQLNDYNKKSGKKYKVMASIGYYSETISENTNTDKMIKIADEQMYHYKIAHRRKR